MTKTVIAALALALSTLPLSAQEIAPPPEVGREFATTPIVIETSLGPITVALETERAPITTANFLRYVDEDRFDGIVFYRAMKLDWEQPNGLIQAGTQYDPKRTLPPIRHEPTSETGVLHKQGVISMARNEPGTATGDWSIWLRDQPFMNADPDNPDPERQAGYAAFGYVTDGWDVVLAIHNQPTDPEKGEGWMKGQMLAEPVKIIDVSRIEATAKPPSQVQ